MTITSGTSTTINAVHHETARDLADRLVTFLETNQLVDGLFADDVFLDLTLPHWRLQTVGAEAALATRRQDHQGPGRLPRTRFDVTGTGFLLEIEEEWENGGDQWYCRELIRCDVTDGKVSEISVYCTGDWDTARVAEHREAVTLLRP